MRSMELENANKECNTYCSKWSFEYSRRKAEEKLNVKAENEMFIKHHNEIEDLK